MWYHLSLPSLSLFLSRFTPQAQPPRTPLERLTLAHSLSGGWTKSQNDRVHGYCLKPPSPQRPFLTQKTALATQPLPAGTPAHTSPTTPHTNSATHLPSPAGRSCNNPVSAKGLCVLETHTPNHNARWAGPHEAPAQWQHSQPTQTLPLGNHSLQQPQQADADDNTIHAQATPTCAQPPLSAAPCVPPTPGLRM